MIDTVPGTPKVTLARLWISQGGPPVGTTWVLSVVDLRPVDLLRPPALSPETCVHCVAAGRETWTWGDAQGDRGGANCHAVGSGSREEPKDFQMDTVKTQERYRLIVSVTSILDPKKREIRVEKRLNLGEKKHLAQ